VARGVCELFREPDPQLGFLFGSAAPFLGGGVTMGQILSLPMAIAGIVAIALASRGRTRPRDALAPSA
jgi:phosphatidylglycerol---prolipoprotein diacylglyceryl transferase